jgi:hypothetical protein
MSKLATAPPAGAPDMTLNVKPSGRAHGTTGAMITSGVAFVLATVVVIFFVAAYARPAAKAEFLARLAADHAAACDRLGQGSGTSDHAVCMGELMRLNVCPNQGF